MPVAARELNGVSVYAFAFSAYFTTSLFGMVLAGQWSDRKGPLAPLATGISAFAAGLLLSGTAGAMWMFVLGRAVQGLGGGLVIVALYVVVSRAYDEHLRPAIMAAFAASWVVPPSSGRSPPAPSPSTSAGAGSSSGSRSSSSCRSPSPSPRSAAPPRGPPTRRRPPPLGPAPDPAGARHLRGRRAPPVRRAGTALALPAARAAGAALLVPAVRLLPRGTYRAARGLPSVVLLRGIAAGSFIAAESFVPLMLVTQRGLSPTLAGLSLAVGGLTWALGSWIQSRPWTEPYRERLVVLGMVLVALAIAAAPSVLITAVPAWTVAVAWAFGCLGMGAVISSTSVLLLKLSAPEEAGTNSAALQISDGLSNVLLLRAAGGAAFAALGGGAVGHAVTSHTAATGSHPAAFAAVFLPMAGVAAAGRGSRRGCTGSRWPGAESAGGGPAPIGTVAP